MPDPSLPAIEHDEVNVVDAYGRDPAGNMIGVILFARDGYLTEVEVYSVEGPFGGIPDPAALTTDSGVE